MTEPGRHTDSDSDRTQALSTVDLPAPGAASAEASWHEAAPSRSVEMSTNDAADAAGEQRADAAPAWEPPVTGAHEGTVASTPELQPSAQDGDPAEQAAADGAPTAEAPQATPQASAPASAGLPLVTPASRAGLPPVGARSIPRSLPVNPLGSRSNPGSRGSGGSRPGAPRSRRARLRLSRIDPLSVFLLSLVVSLFLAIVLVVAVVALYAALTAAGVPGTINDLVAEVTRASSADASDPQPLLTASRVVTAAGVVAAVDVVLLTALSTLGALLYNVCASFTGGLEVTLAEPEDR